MLIETVAMSVPVEHIQIKLLNVNHAQATRFLLLMELALAQPAVLDLKQTLLLMIPV